MSFFESKKNPVKPLPFPIYFWTTVSLALAGLLNSIYLAVSHYRVYTDIGYRSFCAISKAINCDTVSQSPYSIILNVPVPVWGVIGYSLFLLVLSFARCKPFHSKHLWSLLVLIAWVFSCISAVLALILTTFIHSYCIMCMLSYGINFALLFFAALTRRRFTTGGFFEGIRLDFGLLYQKKIKTAAVFAAFLAIMGAALLTLPDYWNIHQDAMPTDIPRGITEEGHPWIGAESPELTVIEFSDYLCFQCKKMHYYLRQIVAENPTKIRLVHRHFPMDHEVNFIVKDPFHIGSGKMALAAIYAASKGKFWEMNDLLFDLAGNEKEMNLKDLAAKTGLEPAELAYAVNSKSMHQRLRIDVWTALKHRMVGTPSFQVNGKIYQGQLPPEILKKALGKV